MKVFGMEDDINLVRKNLIEKKPLEFLGIKIYGQSGSGKTELAKCVYNDVQVSHYFEMRAWFTVGTSLNARAVLESLYYSLSSDSLTKKEIASMDQFLLPICVEQKLREKRCLIVLDDVCSSNNIWKQGLESALAFAEKNKRGSRIIVTTSWNDLEGYKLKPEFQHVMQPMELVQKRKLFNDRYSGAALQNEMVDEICTFSDLPLGIVVLASVFRGENPRILNSIKEIWDFSLEKLPDYLKQYLRYLQQFPPDKWISVEKLRLLWMAEGILKQYSTNDKSEWDVANDHYNELTASGLVIEEEQNCLVAVSSQRFASCKLRPSIHQKDSTVINITEGKRLSIDLDKVGDKNHSEEKVIIADIKNDLSNVNKPKDITSILFFGVSGKNEPDNIASTIVNDLEKNFKSTQVLEFNGVYFSDKGMARWGIENLKQLKYLSFQGCNLEKLPSSIEKLNKCLETLDLGVVGEMVIPENLVGKLSKLRHLYFPRKFNTKKGKLKLNTVKDLEILENFDAEKCDSEDLNELKKLRRLTCIGVDMPLQLLEKLPNLKSLVLRENISKSGEKEMKEMVFQGQFFRQLTSLKLENFRSLTKLEVKEAESSQLAVLTINNCKELKNLPCDDLAKMKLLKKLITGGKYPKQIKKINVEREKEGIPALATT